jgi:serine/threonine protein kinase
MSSLTRLLQSLPPPLNNKYEILNVIGVGSYAVVYQVKEIESGQSYALKMIEKEPMRIRAMIPQVKREIHIGTYMSGTPYITELVDTQEIQTHYFLRFALCRTSLDKVSKSNGPMSESETMSWLRMACKGVKELHDSDIIHRDLKPGNFLVDYDGKLRICDFGFSCYASENLSGIVGTVGYFPPEARKGGPVHTRKMDSYGLGACLQHLLLGRIPNGPKDMPKKISAKMQALIEELMSADPDARPDIDEIIASQGWGDTIFSQWLDGWAAMLRIPACDGTQTMK